MAYKDKKTYLCLKLEAMKKLLLLTALVFVLASCHHNDNANSLIGTWIVDKVNVQFDEQHNTPEMVKQFGEMEKQNIITIDADSMLIFKGLEEEWQGKISLKNKVFLNIDGTDFGQWKEGQIITKTTSPIGEVVVTYRKKQ